MSPAAGKPARRQRAAAIWNFKFLNTIDLDWYSEMLLAADNKVGIRDGLSDGPPRCARRCQFTGFFGAIKPQSSC